jgi:signal transduction histidine kinase
MPVAVFLLGVLSIAVLIWTRAIDERQRANFAFIGLVKDLRTKTAAAHVWLEEAIAEEGDAEHNRELARSNLADAVKLSEALLQGGKDEYGLTLQPQSDRDILEQADKAAKLLSSFGVLAKQRFAHPGASGRGSRLDERFDAIFIEILSVTSALESISEKRLASDNVEMTRLFMSVLFTWSLIVLGATAGLWNREVKRKDAEDALQEAKDGLEVKVSERTRELGEANERLGRELGQRKLAEEALLESSKKFRGLYEQFHSLLNAIPDSITLLTPDLRIIWANKGAVTAAKGAEVAGRNCYELWHHTSGPCDGCGVLRSFQTGKRESSQSTALDGRIWELRAFPMIGDDGQVKSVIEIAADITEKTMLHKEAERMAQLASVGELAAGVAHEINNPVNGVINCAELLINKAGPDSREHELGKRILKEGDRIASIVKGLLSFSRQESEEMGPAEVPDLLADTLALTEAQMKKEGITLRVDTGKEALSVRAQPHRLEQVFLNLINNARDALNEKYPQKNEGKMLSIVAKRVATDSGPRVRIAFHDQGAGIPPQVMSRVMNPFFSTKPTGKGTGLGLSISHGIVERHGGRLTIDSREGEFTEVVVELPVLDEGEKVRR